MAAPIVYTDVLVEVREWMKVISNQIKVLNKKMDDENYVEPAGVFDNISEVPKIEEFVDEEIKEKGYNDRIAYNMIEEAEHVDNFRQFIYEVRSNPKSSYTPEELDYVEYADKNFKDIRLSNRHLKILQNVYRKCYNKEWPFAVVKGYLYQYEGEKTWEWFRR